MKTISSVSRIAFLTLALASAGATVAFAQTTPATPPAAPADNSGGRHSESVLTADEKAQYDKAYTAAIAADPTLKTDEDNLKAAHQALRSNASATDADKAALKQQGHDFTEKLHAAMLKIDSTLQPIFDKLAAAHKGGRGQ